MKIVITSFVFIALGLFASPTGIFLLTEQEIDDSGFSFRLGRTIQASAEKSEWVYVFATFPTPISLNDRAFQLSAAEPEDQAFMHETSIQLGEHSYEEEVAFLGSEYVGMRSMIS
jgi:hypothetical protein